MLDALQGRYHIIGFHCHHEDIGVVHLLRVCNHADRNREVHQTCNGCSVFLQVGSTLTTSDQRNVFSCSHQVSP